MISRVLAYLLVPIIFLCGCASSSINLDFIGQKPPLIRLTMLDGNYMSLEDLRGKRITFLFWGLKCPWSSSAVRNFDRYAARFKDRKDLIFMAISIDELEREAELQERIKEDKLDTVQHVFSGNGYYDEAYIAFNVEELPTYFVINPEGIVDAVGDSLGDIKKYMK